MGKREDNQVHKKMFSLAKGWARSRGLSREDADDFASFEYLSSIGLYGKKSENARRRSMNDTFKRFYNKEFGVSESKTYTDIHGVEQKKYSDEFIAAKQGIRFADQIHPVDNDNFSEELNPGHTNKENRLSYGSVQFEDSETYQKARLIEETSWLSINHRAVVILGKFFNLTREEIAFAFDLRISEIVEILKKASFK